VFELAHRCYNRARLACSDLEKHCLLGESIASLFADAGHIELALQEQKRCHKFLKEMKGNLKGPSGEENVRVKESSMLCDRYHRMLTEKNLWTVKAKDAQKIQEKMEQQREIFEKFKQQEQDKLDREVEREARQLEREATKKAKATSGGKKKSSKK
jgi:hypothetical protein